VKRAVAWAAAKFQAAGADTVVTEAFTVPQAWTPRTAEAKCVAPERFTLRLAAAPDAFEHLGPAARGAIALIASKEMKTLDDLFAEYMKSGPMIAAARKAGVAALLLQSTRPHGCSTGARW
jgi:hypothetical protein